MKNLAIYVQLMVIYTVTPMTEQPSDHCYPQIFFDSLLQREKPGIAYASEVAFFQKAFRRTLYFFWLFLSFPFSCK
ncbi:hypothetical protein CXK86_19415 [Paenibacillus sp. BGI2013]|nr:hypothetical protein BK136_21020 [Paenibacillus amylolyticus]PKQ89753.1 hypothetical protein CXK86_19415 [Paenibacillus sp. BGI2013]